MRILIRGGKPPHIPLTPESSLARWGWGVFGANVGNTLFLQSVYRAVNTADNDVVVDSLYPELLKDSEAVAASINQDFDMYVIPLANAFRRQFLTSLNRLTNVIEKLTIPVVIVGVGGQSSIDGSMSDTETDDATKRFVKAVLSRSQSIGVRGERTSEYLSSLGFSTENISIIGCPSLHDSSDAFPIEKTVERLDRTSPIAMNLTPSAGVGSVVKNHVSRYENLIYVPQEHHELAMLLWGVDADSKKTDLPLNQQHQLFVEDRIRFFLDPIRWYEFMRKRDFSFGTRIHGNIAALAAGTPAVLLAHDSRTLELAEYHKIPFSRDFNEDAADLFYKADFGPFNDFRKEGFNRYHHFLKLNNVSSIFDPGKANHEYDRLLENTAFPPGVRTFAKDRTEYDRELLRKLNWIRQGASVDKSRWVGGYMPEWKPIK